MFDDFALERIDVGEAELRVRHGGSGRPVVLLHGHPRTHATWHRVAPLLADNFTVVCPDLRGYGESSKPHTTSDHAPYSTRAMATDVLDVMSALGHERFAVAGHDRGSYVATRLTLDHPEAVIGSDGHGWRARVDCGHHMAEEAPAELASALHTFWTDIGQGRKQHAPLADDAQTP